ncbi:hypothetical protein E4U55_002198 [Claviceps digitariae]|nr:hypothetical protein E4U55_002198 [Claviceps digitariae]
MEPQTPHDQADVLIHSVISSAAYSPLALGHLPQPVPNDLPLGLNSKVFTFQDAFEDLLVASKGQKLPDIRSRYQQRQHLWRTFPDGEPGWFWLRRLQSQGLVRPFDPFTFINLYQPDWSTLHEERRREAAVDPWGNSHSEDSTIPTPAPAPTHAIMAAAAFAALGTLEKMHKLLFDLKTTEKSIDNARHHDTALVNKPQLIESAKNYSDFCAQMRPLLEEQDFTWDTFMKLVGDMEEKGGFHDENQPFPSAGIDKKDVVTTEKEYVDRFGYLHKTVTRKTLNAEGKEVCSETHVTIQPADKHINNVDGEESNQQSSSETQKGAKKTSWLWK